MDLDESNVLHHLYYSIHIHHKIDIDSFLMCQTFPSLITS
ncbi:protein of unknown function [Shewanella benthica]|uniref:Uncharacterized protein n=1 Tax=Shewanella benthica TaxID=43661 RepID=A0A330M0M1_9GAMM|nr:protein of unknown function [Shewanella benthica]